MPLTQLSRPTRWPACRAMGGLLTLLAMLGGSSAVAQSLDEGVSRSWYGVVGAGVSRLTPDTDASSVTLEEEGSTGVAAWLGRDLTRRLSAEFSVSSLGKAGLSGGAEIDYRAASLGVVGYLLGNPDAIARRESLSVYGRLGLSLIDNESDVELTSADNTAVWAGVGVEWPLGQRYGLRGELASYDGDAQAAWVGVYARLRSSRPARIARRDSPAAEPRADRELASAPAVPPVEPAVEPRAVPAPVRPSRSTPLEPSREPVPSSVPLPVAPGGPDCAAPSAAEPVDTAGCARFSGVLSGVEFVGDGTTLTPVGERLLDRLAADLQRFPDLVVEIQAHVAPLGSADRSKAISRDRAVAVARRLASGGVSVSRLRARAFGAEQPRVAGSEAGARRLNSRIELAVLPD